MARFLAFLATLGSTILFSVGLGFLWDRSDFEPPFFLALVLIGGLCALVSTFVGCALKGASSEEILPSLFPSTLFGFLIGLMIFGFWWSTNLGGSGTLIAGVVGVFTGLSIAVTLARTSEESPIGWPELVTSLKSYGVALVAVLLVCEGDFEDVPILSGLLGMATAVTGGRAPFWELHLAFAPTVRERKLSSFASCGVIALFLSCILAFTIYAMY